MSEERDVEVLPIGDIDYRDHNLEFGVTREMLFCFKITKNDKIIKCSDGFQSGSDCRAYAQQYVDLTLMMEHKNND